jgi:exopolysaccharide biosynthesis polyprenyl glycosylphosphotransferase
MDFTGDEMFFKHIPKKKLLLIAGDLFLISLSLFLLPEYNSYHPLWANMVIVLVYIFLFYLFDLYETHINFQSPKYLFRYLSAISIASIFITGIYFFIPTLKSGRKSFLVSTVVIAILCYAERLLFERWFKRFLARRKNIIIVGAGKAGKTLYKTIRDYTNYNVVGFIDDDPLKWGTSNSPTVLGGSMLLNDDAVIKGIDAIVIAITHLKGADLLRVALDAKMKKIEVFDMPSFYEEVTGKIPVKHVNDFWFVSSNMSGLKKSLYNSKIKRILDIILSFACVILTLPITIVAAVFISMDSHGPVLYKQKRVGLHGKRFVLFKFRSMVMDTDNDREFAGHTNDPRITRVGNIIRNFRIDEIPQMLNVLRGDMSIIGPRALIEEEVDDFKSKIPYFDLRHSGRPGITGWAQVNYKHGVTVEDGLEKLQYDLFYIKNLSPMLDFHILLKTVKVVLFQKGAR